LQNKRLVAGIAVIVFLFLAALIVTQKPHYTATALVVLSRGSSDSVMEDAATKAMHADPYVWRAEIQILSSNSLALQVIDDLKLYDDPRVRESSESIIRRLTWPIRTVFGAIAGLLDRLFGADPGPNRGAQYLESAPYLSWYKDGLSITNDGRSLAVEVAFTAMDPELAAQIASAHAKTYIAQRTERRAAAQKQALEWLKSELASSAAALKTAEQAAQDYRVANGLLVIQSQSKLSSIADQELSTLSEQILSAKADLARQRARVDQIRSAIETGSLDTVTDAPESPTLARLRLREIDARMSMSRLSEFFQGNPSGRNAAKVELDNLQASIRQELRRLEANTSGDVAATESRVRLLEEQFANARTRKVGLDNAEIELRKLEAAVTAQREFYEAMLKRQSALIAEQGYTGTAAKITSDAIPPAYPDGSKKGVLLILSLAASTGLGVAAAFLVDHFRPGPRSLYELARATGLQPIAEIPMPNQQNGEAGHLNRAVFWEQIRGLRNFVVARKRTPGTVILVTSARPGEGKSLVAASLARTLALTSESTILMDCDFRRQTASGVFQARDLDRGVGEVLSGGASLDYAIVSGGADNLAVLPASANAYLSVDVLAGARMQALLDTLKSRYRYVVIDSPPIDAVPDALALAHSCDLTILVARQTTRLRTLDRAVEKLIQAGAQTAGLVVTGLARDIVKLSTKDADLRTYYGGAAASVEPRRGRTDETI
jgi:capsular exopolysaccharide synthesis family protein